VRLTVIGRDPLSAARAKTLFPHALTFVQPDFVLSLPPAQTLAAGGAGTLLCLRNDSEGRLTDADAQALERLLSGPTRRADTWVRRIPLNARTKYLRQMLDLFARHDAVVTDRLHGVIFAALARVPCVAIPTSTHKVESGMAWFREVRFIRFTSDLSAVPAELEAARADRTRRVPNWESEYFDSLPDRLGLK
jgi:exopolysaccharide biosynthesis predicted pyruvyltransferase EpsI